VGSVRLGQKGPAQGHRRARALQIRHESVTDLRIGRQLSEVHPTDPAGRDIADQERPPGKASVPQERNQIIGRARWGLLNRRGAISILTVVAVCSVGHIAQRRPPSTFRSRKPQIILGAHIQTARSQEPSSLFEIDDVPSRVAVAPFLRALEAPLGTGMLCNRQRVQDGPPLRVPAPPAGDGRKTVLDSAQRFKSQRCPVLVDAPIPWALDDARRGA
jgi:hypothetical protein